MANFKIIQPDNFGEWLASQSVSRKITRIQLHHTYQPDYAAWNKTPDALYWQNSMRSYHVNTNGWADIAQQFTICPNGDIVTGRSLNSAPAGIYGANTGAICIENLGNFDRDGDNMTTAQKEAIVTVVGELLKRFNLGTDAVTYHAWWTVDGGSLGDYVAGRSAKTCPGTAFFGGNTRAAYEANLKPLIENYMNGNGGLTMTQYEELKSLIAAKDEIINKMGQEIAALQTAVNAPKMIYNYIDENMPEWARESVQWCVDNGIIVGTGDGLGLDDKDLKWCVIVRRLAAMTGKLVNMKV